MAISLKHAFTSLKSDGTDPTQVQPSHWNAQHSLNMSSGRIIGRLTAGDGEAEEIQISTFMANALASASAEEFLEALGIGGFTTGDIKSSFSATPAAGWILASAGSIGSATSSATILASEDARDLFVKLWDNTSNTVCPVSGGRGGSATLDFEANKRLFIPLLNGRSIIGVGASSVSGGPAWINGFSYGDNVHTLTIAEMPSHSHSNYLTDPSHSHSGVITNWIGSSTGGGAFTVVGTVSFGATNYSVTGTVLTNVANGGNAAHSIIHPSTAAHYHIKL